MEETVVGRDAPEDKRVALRDSDVDDGVDEAVETEDTVVAPEGVREEVLRLQLFAWRAWLRFCCCCFCCGLEDR